MNKTSAPGAEDPDIVNPAVSRRSPRSRWLLLSVLLGAVAAAGFVWSFASNRTGAGATQFRTATATAGDIVQEVIANGSLNPVKNVEVGSQVSGIIQEIRVDFNSHVNEGDVIAQIDPSTYQQNLVEAEAALQNATASLELAEANYGRAKELFKNKLISASEHDTTLAALHQAQATVKIREAAVHRANVDLSRTTIKAPISGVVISRNVDQGQTVAASFNTPKLFLIANDLTKMQIEAAVSEADVGGVEEGQTVSFSVEAYLNQKFLGQVQQVRFAPVTNQNVVTYTAVVEVDNPDLKLRPGMTATARIVTAQKTNVLRVPNSALRFRPPPNVTVLGQTNTTGGPSAKSAGTVATDSSGNPAPPWVAEGRRPRPEERDKWEASLTPEQRERYRQMREQMRRRFAEGGGPGGFGGPGFNAPGGPRRSRTEAGSAATVYVLEKPESNPAKGKSVLKAVPIKTGVSDGAFTEILDGLQPGQTVITGVSTATATTAAAEPPRNPFSPFGGRPRR